MATAVWAGYSSLPTAGNAIVAVLELGIARVTTGLASSPLGLLASSPPRLLASDANPVNLSESIEPL